MDRADWNVNIPILLIRLTEVEACEAWYRVSNEETMRLCIKTERLSIGKRFSVGRIIWSWKLLDSVKNNYKVKCSGSKDRNSYDVYDTMKYWTHNISGIHQYYKTMVLIDFAARFARSAAEPPRLCDIAGKSKIFSIFILEKEQEKHIYFTEDLLAYSLQ